MTRIFALTRSETTAPPALAGADGGSVHGGSDSRPPLTNLVTPRAPDKPWLAARVARRLIAKYSAAWAVRIVEARLNRYRRLYVQTNSEHAAARMIYWDVVFKRCAAVAGLNANARGVA